MIQYYELTEEEKQLLEDFESGKLQRIPDFIKRKKLLMSYAKNTLNKTKNINIRLSAQDLYRLRAKAANEGMPYQTYAASVLHKAAVR